MAGARSRADVLGKPQTRRCECDTPAPLVNEDGRCVKCGHQAELAPERASTREVAEAMMVRVARALSD